MERDEEAQVGLLNHAPKTPPQIFALALLCLLCGCAVHRVTTRPVVLGRVINADTQAAIQGAEIWLDDCITNAVTSVRTRVDGSFFIPAIRERHVHWFAEPLECYFPRNYTLRVSHPGYTSSYSNFLGSIGLSKPTTNFIPVTLQVLKR